MDDGERERAWDLVEQLEDGLTSPEPDWKALGAMAEELWTLLSQASCVA